MGNIAKFYDELIPTIVLIQDLILKLGIWFETSLIIRNIRATYFLLYNGELLYDEGIDGERREIKLNVFSAEYKQSCWKIDQTISQ